LLAIVIGIVSVASYYAIEKWHSPSGWSSVKSNVEKISVWENGKETIIDPQDQKFDEIGEVLYRILESPVDVMRGVFTDNGVIMLKEMAKLVEMKYKQGENFSQSMEYSDFLFILEADPLEVGMGNGIILKGYKNPQPEIMQSEMLYGVCALTKNGEIDKSWVYELNGLLEDP
jgi:hypothetical protein